MNRRLFMGLIAGLTAAPAAIAAAFKPKPALPPIPEVPGFKTVWVKPREAMSQYGVCQLCGQSRARAMLFMSPGGIQTCVECAMERITGIPDGLKGDLFAVTDTAYFSDKDYAVTVVFKRHGDGIIEIMDDFEWPHTLVVEHGVEYLERGAIESVRRYGPPTTTFYPTRLHTDDLPGGVLKQTGAGWKPIKLPRFE